MNYVPTMCDIATETNLVTFMHIKPETTDACVETESIETANFECQVPPFHETKSIKQILILERDKDSQSVSENSFNTIEQSRSGDKSPQIDNLSCQDDDQDILDSWIPEIEQFIEKMKPAKKTSTFFQAHQKEKLTASADPSPRAGFKVRFSGIVKEDESTESSVKLASHLSSMIDSYKQVCKERDYLKNLLQPYMNKGRKDDSGQLDSPRVANKRHRTQEFSNNSPLYKKLIKNSSYPAIANAA